MAWVYSCMRRSFASVSVEQRRGRWVERSSIKRLEDQTRCMAFGAWASPMPIQTGLARRRDIPPLMDDSARRGEAVGFRIGRDLLWLSHQLVHCNTRQFRVTYGRHQPVKAGRSLRPCLGHLWSVVARGLLTKKRAAHLGDKSGATPDVTLPMRCSPFMPTIARAGWEYPVWRQSWSQTGIVARSANDALTTRRQQ